MNDSKENKHLIETTLQTERIYEGRILNLRKDKVQLPDGKTGVREIVEHVPAVVILPYQKPETFHLIRQFRLATKQILLEAPAGCIEEGESPIEAAKRELLEETGLIAKNWIPLGGAYMTPGFCEEYLHFFLAQGLSESQTNKDEDEFLERVMVSPQEMETLIQNQDLIDGKTLIAYQLSKPYL